MAIVASRIVAAALSAAILMFSGQAALAQSGDAKPADQRPQGENNAKEVQKVDEFAEAERLVSGPAGSAECVWLGRRVVSLLWRDDLDTAFRHLDLYDRFGCPGAHIQTTFRCIVRHGNFDPKIPETLNSRVHACWVAPLPAAAANPEPAAPAARPAPSPPAVPAPPPRG